MQDNKIKILYLVDKFTYAGSQKHVCTLAMHIDAEKFEPLVCCLRDTGPLEEIYKSHNIKTFTLNQQKIYGLSALKSLFKLISILKQEKIDIVHTYQFNPTIFGVIAARLAGIKVVITTRRDTGYWAKKWHHTAFRIANIFTTKVLANSEAVKNSTIINEKITKDKIEVIYNGVDTAQFDSSFDKNAIKERYGIYPQDKIIGMVAVIRPEKLYEDFIKAAGLVLKNIKNVKFLIAGSGYPDLTDKLKDLCKKEGIEDNVVFTGRLANAASIISIFDVAVLASKSEGFSNVILEYMASGKAVIATSVGGNPEIIKNGTNGILIKIRDYEQLAKDIEGLLKNPRLASYFGNNAKELISNRFTAKIMAEKTMAAYERLLTVSKRTVLYMIKLRLRSHSIFFIFKTALRRILKPIFQVEKLEFFEKELEHDKDFYFDGKNNQRLKAYINRIKKNYDFSIFSKSNINGYINELALLMHKDKNFIKKWLNQGKYCFTFCKKGRIISYFWLTVGARYHSFMGKNYKADKEAFVHNALTLKEARGKGLASLLLNEMFIFASRNNAAKMNGFIVSDNLKSVNSFIEPLGCKISERKALYLKIFNKEKYFVYE